MALPPNLKPWKSFVRVEKTDAKESFPVEAAEKDNYKSQANRRVELVFNDKDKAPKLLDPPSSSEPIPKEKCEVYDPEVTEKKPIEIIETEPPLIPDEEGPMVFYAPGLNEYFLVEPADIDALATEVKELETFAVEIKKFRESFNGKNRFDIVLTPNPSPKPV